MNGSLSMLPNPLQGTVDGDPVRVIGLFWQFDGERGDDFWLIVNPDGEPSWVKFKAVRLSELYAPL